MATSSNLESFTFTVEEPADGAIRVALKTLPDIPSPNTIGTGGYVQLFIVVSNSNFTVCAGPVPIASNITCTSAIQW